MGVGAIEVSDCRLPVEALSVGRASVQGAPHALRSSGRATHANSRACHPCDQQGLSCMRLTGQVTHATNRACHPCDSHRACDPQFTQDLSPFHGVDDRALAAYLSNGEISISQSVKPLTGAAGSL